MMSVVVPYRGRPSHLERFLVEIQAKGGVPLAVMVVEQYGSGLFNKGRLCNIGFDITKGLADYFCFHDVDMMPVDVDYSMPDCVMHLATRASQFSYKMPGANYFGGVNLFRRCDFEAVNGFSNGYLGWGCEDDDLRKRVLRHGLVVGSRECVFECLPHDRTRDEDAYRRNYERLCRDYDYSADGLSSLRYKVLEMKEINGYAKLALVDGLD